MAMTNTHVSMEALYIVAREAERMTYLHRKTFTVHDLQKSLGGTITRVVLYRAVSILHEYGNLEWVGETPSSGGRHAALYTSSLIYDAEGTLIRILKHRAEAKQNSKNPIPKKST